MATAALLLLCALTPAFALLLERRFAVVRAVGAVLLCCGLGVVVVNQPVVAVDDAFRATIASVGKLIATATIPLAIPLLLFQSDLGRLRAHGRSAVMAFVIATVAVIVGVTVASLWLADDGVPERGKAAGMIMSVYVGGTPNLVAVQRGLSASEETFGLVYAATTFVSTFYLVFLLTVAKPVLRRFFPAHPDPEPMGAAAADADPGPRPRRTRQLRDGAISVAMSALCVLISAGVVAAVLGTTKGEGFSLGVILVLTTVSLGASFISAVKRVPTHEAIGTYLILVFCVSAGLMMDVSTLMARGGVILQVTAVGLGIALLVHYLLCRLARLDVDTSIVMSVATVYGPPFVPAVVQALGNKRVLVPGMTMGFLGYAVGTYAGIAIGALLSGGG